MTSTTRNSTRMTFQSLTVGLTFYWSEGYTALGCTFLSEHSERFYALQRSESYQEPFSLFDPNIYIPENCQGFAQTFLVCTALYIVKQYTDNPLLLEDPKHPCYNFFTQGNPGTGKTFVIMTILNCVRVLRGCVMECAASVAPTGCAASLSKGRTSHRFFKFPAGNRISAQPYDSNTSKIADAQAFLNQMEALIALVLDKVSMKGRNTSLGKTIAAAKVADTLFLTPIALGGHPCPTCIRRCPATTCFCLQSPLRQ
jgi:hypothetical protein